MMSSLSWFDLSSLNSSEILNINAERWAVINSNWRGNVITTIYLIFMPSFLCRTHDSSWLLMKDLDSCVDQNGNTFPEPARLANTDYFSYGYGKYNLPKPIFALLPDGTWALHDFRTQFANNTPEDPMEGEIFM